MPRLLVYGISHVENLGDRLVYRVVEAALSAMSRDLEIVRVTPVDWPAAIPGYHQASETEWVELANQCDMALVLGGSVFFPDFIQPLSAARACELRVPLAVWGGVQDPGWLETIEGTETVRTLLGAAARTFVRFPPEQEVLCRSHHASVALGGDPTFLLPRALPKDEGVLALCLSRYLAERFPDSAAALPAAVGMLQRRYKVVALWCESADAAFFADLLRGVPGISGEAEVLSVLRSCAGVVGCRLHPLIVGAAQNVPIVGIEIGSMKIRWLMESLGAQSALVDLTRSTLSPGCLEAALAAWECPMRERAWKAASELGDAARGALHWIGGSGLRRRAGG